MHQNEVRIHLRRLVTLSDEAQATHNIWKLYTLHRQMKSILNTLRDEAPNTYNILKENGRFPRSLIP